MSETAFYNNSTGFYELVCSEKACGQVFFVTSAKFRDLQRRYGTTPRRCEKCRVKKRECRERLEEKQRKLNSPFFQFLPKPRREAIRREHIE